MEREIFEQAVREYQDMVFRVALHCFITRSCRCGRSERSWAWGIPQ